MKTRSVIAVLSALLATMCAGSARIGNDSAVVSLDQTGDETTDDFDVTIEQENAPMVMGAIKTVDVKYRIEVKNRTTEPVTITHISLQSLGAGDFQIPLRSRPFNEVIEPGKTEKLPFWAPAQVEDATVGTKAPLTLRATLTIRDGGGERNESFLRYVNGRVAVGVTSP